MTVNIFTGSKSFNSVLIQWIVNLLSGDSYKCDFKESYIVATVVTAESKFSRQKRELSNT